MEEWRKVEEFPNYSVSNLGRVRNDNTNTILNPWKLVSGYRSVTFPGKNSRLVHRIVADAFIPNLLKKPQVNHINGIKDDNRVENLEWVTASENCFHSYNTLDSSERRRAQSERQKGRPHTKEWRRHLKASLRQARGKKVLCLETGMVFETVKDASDWLGKKASPKICDVCRGKRPKAYGFHWEYYQEVS